MRTGATFRVHGIDRDEVTAILGVAPSASGASKARWSLRTEVRDGVELAESLAQLLDVLEPAAGSIAELRELGATFDFFCYLGSHALEHAAVLSPSLLTRIAALDAELWIDVYGEDTDDRDGAAT